MEITLSPAVDAPAHRQHPAAYGASSNSGTPTAAANEPQRFTRLKSAQPHSNANTALFLTTNSNNNHHGHSMSVTMDCPTPQHASSTQLYDSATAAAEFGVGGSTMSAAGDGRAQMATHTPNEPPPDRQQYQYAAEEGHHYDYYGSDPNDEEAAATIDAMTRMLTPYHPEALEEHNRLLILAEEVMVRALLAGKLMHSGAGPSTTTAVATGVLRGTHLLGQVRPPTPVGLATSTNQLEAPADTAPPPSQTSPAVDDTHLTRSCCGGRPYCAHEEDEAAHHGGGLLSPNTTKKVLQHCQESFITSPMAAGLDPSAGGKEGWDLTATVACPIQRHHHQSEVGNDLHDPMAMPYSSPSRADGIRAPIRKPTIELSSSMAANPMPAFWQTSMSPFVDGSPHGQPWLFGSPRWYRGQRHSTTRQHFYEKLNGIGRTIRMGGDDAEDGGDAVSAIDRLAATIIGSGSSPTALSPDACSSPLQQGVPTSIPNLMSSPSPAVSSNSKSLGSSSHNNNNNNHSTNSTNNPLARHTGAIDTKDGFTPAPPVGGRPPSAGKQLAIAELSRQHSETYNTLGLEEDTRRQHLFFAPNRVRVVDRTALQVAERDARLTIEQLMADELCQGLLQLHEAGSRWPPANGDGHTKRYVDDATILAGARQQQGVTSGGAATTTQRPMSSGPAHPASGYRHLVMRGMAHDVEVDLNASIGPNGTRPAVTDRHSAVAMGGSGSGRSQAEVVYVSAVDALGKAAAFSTIATDAASDNGGGDKASQGLTSSSSARHTNYDTNTAYNGSEMMVTSTSTNQPSPKAQQQQQTNNLPHHYQQQYIIQRETIYRRNLELQELGDYVTIGEAAVEAMECIPYELRSLISLTPPLSPSTAGSGLMSGVIPKVGATAADAPTVPLALLAPSGDAFPSSQPDAVGHVAASENVPVTKVSTPSPTTAGPSVGAEIEAREGVTGTADDSPKSIHHTDVIKVVNEAAPTSLSPFPERFVVNARSVPTPPPAAVGLIPTPTATDMLMMSPHRGSQLQVTTDPNTLVVPFETPMDAGGVAAGKGDAPPTIVGSEAEAREGITATAGEPTRTIHHPEAIKVRGAPLSRPTPSPPSSSAASQPSPRQCTFKPRSSNASSPSVSPPTTAAADPTPTRSVEVTAGPRFTPAPPSATRISSAPLSSVYSRGNVYCLPHTSNNATIAAPSHHTPAGSGSTAVTAQRLFGANQATPTYNSNMMRPHGHGWAYRRPLSSPANTTIGGVGGGSTRTTPTKAGTAAATTILPALLPATILAKFRITGHDETMDRAGIEMDERHGREGMMRMQPRVQQ